MASKVINEMRRSEREVVFMIDFEKTYDYMNWDFLVFVFQKLGFGETWIRWIKRCVMGARVSVLVNGSADSEFQMERGRR